MFCAAVLSDDLCVNCIRCHTCVKISCRPLISRWKLLETENVEKTIYFVTTIVMVIRTGNVALRVSEERGHGQLLPVLIA